jgi:Arc/MetJ family transcription regulator
MRTNIDIDDKLMRQAMRLGGIDTKKATVEAALRLFIQTRSQVGMRRFRGKVKWEGSLSKASPLDVKGVKLGISTADLAAIVRQGRERG